MSRICFLDFDGVLNSTSWFIKRKHREDRFHDDIDPGTIGYLNRIVLATNCDVVISSTWRKVHSVAKIRGLLNSLGFLGSIVGATPNLNCARGHEIKKWIERSPTKITNICILDDDSDMLGLMPWLVKTDNNVGLTTAKALEAIAMLERPYPL